jgi:hypothetical protein
MLLYILKIIFGICLILYGIYNIVISFISTYGTIQFKLYLINKYPFIEKTLIQDTSIAGKILEVICIILGFNTILSSLNNHFILHKKIRMIINSNFFALFLYGILGGFMTIFYYLVVYTNIKIDKNEKSIDKYKMGGLIGGLSLLIMIPIITIRNILNNLPLHWQSQYFFHLILSILIVLLILIIIIFIIKKTLEENYLNVKNNMFKYFYPIKSDLKETEK